MSVKDSSSKSYAEAGVDVTAGYKAVDMIKPLIESTYTDGVLGGIGGFGGMFAPDLSNMKQPVLVSGTDGVGTKLKIAFLLDKHDTIGIDCVAMCVNDIICSGAVPLFFLDYIAMGKNYPEKVARIVSGIADGCRRSGCSLVGGETAEMPGIYPEDEYDLAGFAVGIVDRQKIIDGSRIAPGDILIGFSSSGLHSNGFSLVRKVLSPDPESLSKFCPELCCTLGEELLKPTRIYVSAVHSLLRSGIDVKGICHITGGGFYENVPRMLPEGVRARIDLNSFPVHPIFEYIQNVGGISEHDMYNTFNMGLGLIIALGKDDVGHAVEAIVRSGERPYIIGRCVSGEKGVDLC
ncbi:MAG: phosphoribosylformylglycinamidine cyclo-ligase [Oscillospiraceae bacterium]|jgi:phosphoribosylformylglycinamidine cyclo-ligase